MNASSERVPRIIRSSTTRFGWRHVEGVALVRFLVGIWLVCLASIFCAFGDWWGALLFVAAGLCFYLAYKMPRWKLALGGESDVHVQDGSRSSS